MNSQSCTWYYNIFKCNAIVRWYKWISFPMLPWLCKRDTTFSYIMALGLLAALGEMFNHVLCTFKPSGICRIREIDLPIFKHVGQLKEIKGFCLKHSSNLDHKFQRNLLHMSTFYICCTCALILYNIIFLYLSPHWIVL